MLKLMVLRRCFSVGGYADYEVMCAEWPMMSFDFEVDFGHTSVLKPVWELLAEMKIN